MPKDNPKISVIMTVYNSEKYLREAIDSILSQTFSDFEFIIVNDSSTDRSSEIIKSCTDKRLIILENEMNLGLPKSINKAILVARGEFIARMDADDISLPTRLEEQICFMEKHSDIALCGTFAESIGTGKSIQMSHPTDPDEIKVNLLFKTSVIHPSMMIRRKFLVENRIEYNPNFLQTQDYDLLVRISRIGKISNIPKILLKYRKHNKQASVEKNQNQIGYAKKIIEEQLKYLKITPTDDEINTAVSVKRYLFINDMSFLPKLQKLFLEIKTANEHQKIYSEKSLKKVFGDIWLEVATAYRVHNTNIWSNFWHGAARKWIKPNPKNLYRTFRIFILNF